MEKVRLCFDRFGSAALAGHAAERGSEATDVIVAAARHLLAELGRGRMAVRLPHWARPSDEGSPRVHMHCELPPDTAEALEGLAAQQGVPVRHLLEHAALLYLADVDAGRLGEPDAAQLKPEIV